jgi:uncharacterized membrane protein
MTTRTIRNPVEWTGDQVLHAAHGLAATGRALHHAVETLHSPAPAVRRITAADLGDALAKGLSDEGAYRTDVFFLVVGYPILCLMAAYVAFDMNMIPLLFPLASGIAIVGPAAAVGLHEMSRRRERGMEVSWRNAFDVVHRPAIGGILMLGVLLTALFLSWLAAAWIIYSNTMGPALPDSAGQFLRDALTTDAGHLMMIEGVGAGFLFAVVAMAISVVSFPLMVDRDIGLDSAVKTSVRAVMANPGPMAAWGLIVAAGLVLGSLPLFVGLVIVIPVLGHATWHLYRKLVEH